MLFTMLSAPFGATGIFGAAPLNGAISKKNQVLPVAACAILVAILCLTTTELVLGLVGALGYAALQVHQTMGARGKKGKARANKIPLDKPTPVSVFETRSRQQQQQQQHGAPVWAQKGVAERQSRAGSFRRTGLAQQPPKQQERQESVKPVLPSTFQSVGWEAEVQELLQQITPTPENDQVVQKLVEVVQKVLLPIIPEAEVSGFASGSIKGNKAFGVAVPEVDIVVNASPAVLVQRLRNLLPNGLHLSKLDAKKLQKSAIRACTDQLVSKAGFKFRRSAFRCDEPKFTLLVPSSLGISEEAIAIDFSVNSPTPLYAAALFTECGQLDARAKDLILLVRRWARDRGISHAARGHLPPYAWTLLVIYFLQVGVEEDAVLPSFDAFASSCLSGKRQAAQAPVQARAKPSNTTSAAMLFQEFVRFYHDRFNYREEAVSVRRGLRAAPDLGLPLHIVLSADGTTTHVGPSIEDPFSPKKNIASCMTVEGLTRFHEELDRAKQLCSEQASLATLLQLWAPPVHAATGGVAGAAGQEELSS